MLKGILSHSVLALAILGMVVLSGTVAHAYPGEGGSFGVDAAQSGPHEELEMGVSDFQPSSGAADAADVDGVDVYLVEGIENLDSPHEEREGWAVDEGSTESSLVGVGEVSLMGGEALLVSGGMKPLLYGYNSEEVKACINRLGVKTCYRARALGNQASKRAQEWFPGQPLEDTRGDAFRHCYWSALMTRNLNVYVAAIVGDYHEHYATGQTEAAKWMDLYNNQRGRDVAALTSSDDEAAGYCYHASGNGTLLVLK